MNQYWQEQTRRLGRSLLFIDTGAILKVFEKNEDDYALFLEQEAVNYRFVTSTYVVAETVRRLTKAKYPDRHTGPRGEKGSQLCLYILKSWLTQQGIHELCIPSEIFNIAKAEFDKSHVIGCDLTDIISFVIVRGLEINEILSPDRQHFGQLGLTCLP